MFFLIALAILGFLQGHFNLTGVGWQEWGGHQTYGFFMKWKRTSREVFQHQLKLHTLFLGFLLGGSKAKNKVTIKRRNYL